MNQRLLRTLLTAASLLVCQGVYSLVVSPFATPPAQSFAGPSATTGSGGSVEEETGPSESESPDEGPRMPQQRRDLLGIAAQSLPHAPWAAQARYAVRSSNSYVYAEEWVQEEDSKRVRFAPFAMVWRAPNARPGEQPLTVICDAALLEFAHKFDMRNPKPGRVVGGSLQGPVQIRGANGLAINTRNLNFSESSLRAWSDNEIDFVWGEHRGKAQGLEIDLIRQDGPPDDDKPAVAGLRTIRLLNHVELWLQPGASDPRRQEAAATTNTRPAGGRPPVHITCDGKLEYKLEVLMAVLSNNVRVVQPTSTGLSDRLTTETLALEFVRGGTEAEPIGAELHPENAASGSQQAAGTVGDTPGVDVASVAKPTPPAEREARPEAGRPAKPDGEQGLDGLQFRWLKASGPGTRIESDKALLTASMDELIYDEPTRTVTLRGTTPVRVLQRNNQLQCPEIAVVLDDEEEIVSAHCRGNGRLIRYGGPLSPDPDTPRPKVDFAARWEGELNYEPDQATGGNTIDLQKRVILTRPGGLRLSAERVRVWLARDEAAEGEGPRNKRRLPEDNRTRPERMLALRQVEIKSPQMIGATERLELWFEEGQLGPPPVAGREANTTGIAKIRRADGRTDSEGVDQSRVHQTQAGTSSRPGETDEPANALADDRGAAQIAGRPAGRGTGAGPERLSPDRLASENADTPTLGEAAAGEKGPTRLGGNSPLLISADVIRVQMLLNGDDADVDRIRTEGHVRVTQSHGPQVAPLDVRGDRLQLWNYTNDRQVLQVQGKPAHVNDRGLRLEGEDVRFDRGANLATVQGKGVLRLPIRNGIDGRQLPESRLVDIFWKEKMEFDGQTARFFASVRTQLDGTELACEEMQVRLTRRVSFVADNADQEPELERVTCRDGVNVKSHEYQENRLQGVRLASGHEFVFEQQTGEMLGEGPGELVFWTRSGGQGLADLAGPGPKGAKSKPAKGGPTLGWSYTRVEFSGRMKGNANQRRSTFQDRVRVVYGPVDSPSGLIDVDRLPALAGTLRCEELTVTQMPAVRNNPEYVTLLAKGNAELEGRADTGWFSALAYTVSFDQSKGMYVLAGDGKREAEITRETTPGAPRPAVNRAMRIEFLPARNELNIIKASSAQGGA